MIKLVGLTGLAGSGKDTAASLVSNYYHQYAFAKPIKDACAAIFGWDHRHLHGELKEVEDPVYAVSPRKAMQTLGTQWGRHMINPNIWLRRAEQEIISHTEAPVYSPLIITDVRFDNEAELIRKHGGIIVDIVRPDNLTRLEHISENGVSPDLVDYIVINDGTIDDLGNTLRRVLKGE